MTAKFSDFPWNKITKSEFVALQDLENNPVSGVYEIQGHPQYIVISKLFPRPIFVHSDNGAAFCNWGCCVGSGSRVANPQIRKVGEIEGLKLEFTFGRYD